MRTRKGTAFVLALFTALHCFGAGPVQAKAETEMPLHMLRKSTLAGGRIFEDGTEDGKDTSGEPAVQNETLKSRLSILNYNVQKDGKNITQIRKDETFDLLVNLRDTGILTSALIPENIIQEFESQNEKLVGIPDSIIDITTLESGFSSDARPQVYLKSRGDEPLKIMAVFPSVTWSGESTDFRFDYGLPGAKAAGWQAEPEYQEKSLEIRQCIQQADEPADPEEPTDGNQGADPGFSDTFGGSDYSGGDFGGYSGASDPVQISSATPYIIVSEYSYGNEPVTAGKTFELSMVFRNTSKTLPVENILVSLETDQGLSITSSSNTFYIEKMGPGATVTQKIKLKAISTEQTTSPAINIAFRYEYVDNETRNSQTTDEKIAIPVLEKDRFEVTEPVLPEIVEAGTETMLSFNYVNKGKGTLSNVSMKVDGDIETLTPVQNLGNFEAGKSGTMDLILTPQEPGTEKFTVIITYENTSGDEVVLKYPFELEVTEAAPIWTPEEGNPVEPENQGNGMSWIWWLIAALAAGAGLWYWLKKRKQKNSPDSSVSGDGWEEFNQADGSSEKSTPITLSDADLKDDREK